MDFVTSRSKKYLKRVLENRWTFCRILPIGWDDFSSSPTLRRDKLSWYAYYFNISLLAAYCCFLTIGTFQVCLDPGATLSQVAQILGVDFMYLLVAVTSAGYYLHPSDFVTFYRQYLNTLKQLQELYNAGGSSMELSNCKICGPMLTVVYYVVGSNGQSLALFALLMPSSPAMFSSLLPDPDNLNILVRVLLAAINGYIGIQTFRLSQRTCVTTWFINQSIPDAISFCGEYIDDAKNGAQYSRKYKKSMQMYRSLLILNREYNRVFRTYIFGGHVIVMAVMVVLLYGTLRLGGSMTVIFGLLALNILGLYVSFLYGLSLPHSSSGDLIARLKNCHGQMMPQLGKLESMAMWREIKCMREARVCMGSAYYFDKEIMMTSLETILERTLDLIIMY